MSFHPVHREAQENQSILTNVINWKPKLSAKQLKVGLVALLAFGCLATCIFGAAVCLLATPIPIIPLMVFVGFAIWSSWTIKDIAFEIFKPLPSSHGYQKLPSGSS